MRGTFAAGVLGAMLTLGATTPAEALVVSWVNASGDYVGGETVGGWSVLEYKDAVTGNANGVWSVTGSWDGNGLGFPSSIMWTYSAGNTASVTFGVESNAVAFMLNSDWNDGYGLFSVDGGPAITIDMQTLPNNQNATLVVSDLPFMKHTVTVQSALNAATGNDDLHLYGAAAVSAVPVPGAVWLLGSGLLGIAARRRKTGI